MSTQALENIINRLRSEENRWDAILELKLFDATDYVFYFINLLTDKNWLVRWCSIEKLADIGNAQAIAPLLVILNESDPQLRNSAAKSLVKFGKAALPGLLMQFQNLNVEVRKAVYKVLHSQGGKIVSDLEDALKDQNWIISNRILHLIFNIGGMEAELVLISSLTNKLVQKNCILFLAQLKTKKALNPLFQMYDQPNLKPILISVFKFLGPDTWLELVEKLNGQDLNDAKKAGKILIRLTPMITPLLLTALKARDTNKKRIGTVLDVIQKKEAAKSGKKTGEKIVIK
ncbi:HEAT repeat domain-containing protein [Candidatus Margulisiibacteriota bacterium]